MTREAYARAALSQEALSHFFDVRELIGDNFRPPQGVSVLSRRSDSNNEPAYILFDRPVVGADGHSPRGVLPENVRLRGYVQGVGAVDCLIPRVLIRDRCGLARQPTWRDFEVCWNAIADAARSKIRRGGVPIAASPKLPIPSLSLAAHDFEH
jgi:hypothetical protein